MALAANAELGLTHRFWVVIDGFDLGGWSKCSSLQVTFNSKKITDGGNHNYHIYLPDRLDYGEITLTRAMNAKESGAVQTWLKDRVDGWINGYIADYAMQGGFMGATAQIALFDQHQRPVAVWSLVNVFPKKWAGPELDAKSGNIAMETLTLVHEGFL